MKDNGIMDKCMEKVPSHGQMEENILEMYDSYAIFSTHAI